MSGPSAVDRPVQDLAREVARHRVAIDLERFGPRVEAHSAESARYALAAVVAHAEKAHAPTAVLRESVADLLTDLMHLVERSGAPFEDVLAAARDAYWLDLAQEYTVA